MLERQLKVNPFVVLAAAALAGCAAPPMGPFVQVFPGPGKTFDQFQYDDAQCRQFADLQVRGQANAINQQAAGGAVLGTVLGAGLGAVIGGGRGAAVGAVSGAGLGIGLGATSSSGAQYGVQAQYDNAYAQCMYARGEQVPGLAPAPAVYAPVYAPVLASGLVQAVQNELNRLGYLRSPPDGIDGPQTTSAIQNFEASHGLPVDGMASPPLLDRLRATPVGY